MILSSADPEKFRSVFQPLFTKLESKGYEFSALELGNEINWSNHDLGASGTGRVLVEDDLLHDPKGLQVAKGYLQYLKILSVLKDVRDHSKLNRSTPVLSAGLSPWEPGGGPSGRDAVSLGATIRFLRQNGLDRLVDGYGIHWYPQGQATPVQRLSDFERLVTECRTDKPCWLTEWGLPVHSGKACPVDDTKRAEIFAELRSDYRQAAIEGKLRGILFYDWGDLRPGQQDPYGAFICGGLTPSGRATISTL
jgi:hypothetical protein